MEREETWLECHKGPDGVWAPAHTISVDGPVDRSAPKVSIAAALQDQARRVHEMQMRQHEAILRAAWFR